MEIICRPFKTNPPYSCTKSETKSIIEILSLSYSIGTIAITVASIFCKKILIDHLFTYLSGDHDIDIIGKVERVPPEVSEKDESGNLEYSI